MENFFLTFFNLSINASWLVLAVVLLRFLLKKAPKWVHCILWSLVGIRLVMPFSLESVFSLLPSKQFIVPSALYEISPTVDSGFVSVNEVINPVISEALASSPENSVNPLQVITAIASYMWVTGMIIMCLYTLFTFFSLKRKVGTATKLSENIYQSENVPSPFILGIIRPKIYLPYDINEKDTEYVIAHEKAHLKRKDHLIKPFAFLLLSLYWFNPLLWLAYIILCRDIELACDEKVVKEYAKEECKEYSYALLNCSINRKRIAACPLAFGEVGVKDRIKNVLNYKKPAFWIIIVGILVCIVTAVCFLTVPKGVTLEAGYQYEPMSVKTDKIEITTPENTYIFTDKKQIETLRKLINGITVDKNKTEEIEHPSKSLPEASYVIKALLGDVQTFELCVSRDIKNIWKSEKGECQYLFTSRDAEKLRVIFTTKLNMAYIRQQAEDLVSELLIEYFGYPQVRNYVFVTESHYVIKESFNYTDDAEYATPVNLKLYMIYNCSAFRYISEQNIENMWCAQGVCEFEFDIKNSRVIYKDITEHVRGAGAHLADFGSTEEIDGQLEKEVFEKAKRHFGIDITVNEESTASLQHGDTQTSEPVTYAQNAVDFTYDIVPVYPLSEHLLDSSGFERLVREKSLNSAHLIRNSNKQAYDGQYCLIYRETDPENLITDYAGYIDINEKGEGLTSISEVYDKYEKVKVEKDLYIIYIPDNSGANRYNVTDFIYYDGFLTANIYSFPSNITDNHRSQDYLGFFAVIYAPKNINIYENFTAFLVEEPTILVGGGEINLSDIDSMNIGAEMPKMLYCENGTLIMSGTFGLMVYDIYDKKVTERLDYRLLNKLGIEYLYCTVSSDGSTVYLGNRDFNFTNSSSFVPLFTYRVNSKSLYAYKNELNSDISLYGGISEWNPDGDADILQKGYIYGAERRHSENGGCYLRAKDDWSMKSLQAVIYDHTGKAEIIDIFK